MRTCLNGHTTDEQNNFCPICGNPVVGQQTSEEDSSSIVNDCPHCGAPLELGDAFCGHCGGQAINPSLRLRGTAPQESLPNLSTNPDGLGEIPTVAISKINRIFLMWAIFLVAVQFVMTGITGMHAGSRALALDDTSQWQFHWNFLNYKFEYFRAWHPIAPMGGWIFRIESVLLVGAIGLCLFMFVGKLNRGRSWAWLMFCGLSWFSVLASFLSIMRANQLDYPARDFWYLFGRDSVRAMQGGITVPSAVWLALSLAILVTAIGGFLDSRSPQRKARAIGNLADPRGADAVRLENQMRW